MEVKPAVAAVIHCDVSEMGSWMHPDVGRKCTSITSVHIDASHSYPAVKPVRATCSSTSAIEDLLRFVSLTEHSYSDFSVSLFLLSFSLCDFSYTALHVTAKTMRLRMRKASQQPNPSVASRPSRTKRRHSEVEEDTPTSGGRGLFSTIKKFIRGNAVKVTTSVITSADLAL